jgi:hypothetical protein
MRSDLVVARLALPLRSGGFGLRLTTHLEADTAFLAAAGAADMAGLSAPPPFRPFNPGAPTALPSSLGGRRFMTRRPVSGPRSFWRSTRPALLRSS